MKHQKNLKKLLTSFLLLGSIITMAQKPILIRKYTGYEYNPQWDQKPLGVNTLLFYMDRSTQTLYKSDGSFKGTGILKKFQSPFAVYQMGSELFCSTYPATELWKYDSIADSMTLVQDIDALLHFPNSEISRKWVTANLFCFLERNNNPTNPSDSYRLLLSNTISGITKNLPLNLTLHGDILGAAGGSFYYYHTDVSSNSGLSKSLIIYRVDAEGNTTIAKKIDYDPQNASEILSVRAVAGDRLFDDKLYFFIYTQNESKLYRLNETGVEELLNLDEETIVVHFQESKQKVVFLFIYDQLSQDYSVWRNGNGLSPVFVKAINGKLDNQYGSYNVQATDNDVFYVATRQATLMGQGVTYSELWRLENDFPQNGDTSIQLSTSDHITELTPIHNDLYFIAGNDTGTVRVGEIWKTDGFSSHKLFDVSPVFKYPFSPGAEALANVNDTLYFFASWQTTQYNQEYHHSLYKYADCPMMGQPVSKNLASQLEKCRDTDLELLFEANSGSLSGYFIDNGTLFPLLTTWYYSDTLRSIKLYGPNQDEVYYISDSIPFCPKSPAAEIFVTIKDMDISLTSSPATCYENKDGEINISVSNGTLPYSYLWEDDSLILSPHRANLEGDKAYFCEVKDAKGCVQKVGEFIARPAEIVVIEDTVLSVSYPGGNNGSATVSVSGGNPPYTYNWVPLGISDPVISTVPAGSYTCIVTDKNGCKKEREIEIIYQARPLSVSVASQTNVTCFNKATGAISLAADGGHPPYSFQWLNTSVTQAVITGLQAGTYTCLISDQESASMTIAVTISEGSELTTHQYPTICPKTHYTINGHSYGQSGVYADTLTSHNGCDSVIITHLTVLAEGLLTIVPYGQNSLQALFDGNEIIEAPLTWMDCDSGTTETLPANTYTPPGPGNYLVIYYDQYSCEHASACFSFGNTAIEPESNTRNEYLIFPNPNNGTFTISALSFTEGSIRNVLGEAVLHFQLKAANGFKADCTNLPQGIYYITLKSAQGTSTKQLIITKT